MPSDSGSPAAIGKAAEYLVAASCILASRTKLNVSTSLVDDEGVDLVFHQRGGAATLAVQVKSRTFEHGSPVNFLTGVRKATFRVRPDLYLLFVPVDIQAGSFDFVWFVPSIDFEARTTESGDGYRFAASTKATSRDQWSSYKIGRKELPDRVLAVLSELEARR